MKQTKHDGIEVMDEVLNPKLLKTLETLAGVTEDKIEITERGFKFEFKNSLVANQCRVVRYHDKVIIEMRRKNDNLIEGTYDKLVFEDVIKPQEFKEVFETVSQIYLSYLD